MLECVPDRVAAIVSEVLSIPVIGIGAGSHCDGQALVTHDMLGLFPMEAKFIKKYANIAESIQGALREFCREVQVGSFPGPEYSYSINDDEFGRLVTALKGEISALR